MTYQEIEKLYEIEELPEDRMDCQKLMRKLQMMNNEMVKNSATEEERNAHIDIMRRTSKALAEMFNPQRTANVSMRATNIYDDNDRRRTY